MSGKKILIIDDDQHLLLGLTARLKANGYNVMCAADAISAITVARREAPDLVILDLGLPAGDGFVVLERMRNLVGLVTIPVIVLSAAIRLAMRNVRWKPGRWPSSRSLPIIMNSWRQFGKLWENQSQCQHSLRPESCICFAVCRKRGDARQNGKPAPAASLFHESSRCGAKSCA